MRYGLLEFTGWPKTLPCSTLAVSILASPLIKRAEDVVQGALGTDEYWNEYDGGLGVKDGAGIEG